MKERVLVVIACILSCAIIFGSIIAYKEYKKTDYDIQESSTSNVDEKTEENTYAEEGATNNVNEEPTLKAEESEKNSSEATTVDKKTDKNKTPVEKTTEKNVESTTKETTTEESTTAETTTEKIYPVLAESKADMVRLVNSLTAKASQGSYNLTRVCNAEGEFVAHDMNKLDEFIQKVNPNDTFNSAINRYFTGTVTATVKNGRPTTNVKEEYLLKAMSLTVDNVRTWRQKDDKITVSLKSSRSLYAFQSVTDDFITPDSIDEFMSGYTTEYPVSAGLFGFGPLSLELTIDDGKLTNLKICHSVSVDVEFVTDNRMEGTTYITETTYSDIVYS